MTGDAADGSAGDSAQNAPSDADGPAPLDHYRAGEDAGIEPGVYRVVGRDDERVALLRVVEDGRRVHTGAVVRLPREDFDALAPASDPDAGWGRLRQAPGALADRPLYAAVGVLLVAYGTYETAVAGDGSGLVAVGGGLLVLLLVVR